MVQTITALRKGIWRYLWIVLAVVFVFGLTAWNNANAAPKYIMKLGHATAKEGQDATANFFAKEVTRLSSGSIEATVYNASQLGNNPKMNRDVRSGAQEALAQPTGFSVPYVPILGVLDLPFLFPSTEVQVKILNSPAADRFRREARKAGIEIVAFYSGGFKHMCTRFPLKKAEGFKGRKIRVIQSPELALQFKAFGAIGVPMPLGELYTALQQGVVEGMENPVDLIDRMKFYEVAKYITKTDHGTLSSFIVVNRKWLESLPADLQEAVREAGRNTAERAEGFYSSFRQKAFGVLKEKAVYSIFPETEKAKLKDAGQKVWEEIRKDSAKAEVLQAFVPAIQAAK